MRDVFSEIALICAIFFCFIPAAGQDLESAIEQMAEDGASEADVEDYIQQFKESRRHALDLNAASRQVLERSGLLTRFQLESLLDYRREYGRILSLQELSMIDGFSADFVRQISPLVTLTGAGDLAPPALEIRSRYKYKAGQAGLYQYNRILASSGHWQAGLLAESDAGEKPLADYLGGYIGFEKGPLKLYLGDYGASFGQGLALWSNYTFASPASPSALLMRPRGIAPYKSCDETRALRGLALQYAPGGGWSLSAFGSVRGVDAKVGEGGYTSIQTSGYHRTLYEKACKGAMREYLAGFNASVGRENLQAGICAVAYSFSERNARKVYAYNQWQMYDGWHANVSADVVARFGHCRIFGSLALDRGLHIAAIAGLVYVPSYDFEASLRARYYDKGYIAAHAGAYSTISSVSNQAGVSACMLLRPAKGLQLTSFTELVHYPWLRYRVDAPSSAVYEKLRVEYASGRWTFSAQDHFVWQSCDDSFRHSLKFVAKADCGIWRASLRMGEVLLKEAGSLSSGFACGAELSADFFRRRLSATAGLSVFDTASYQTRVYIYGSDLPSSVSFLYYYGKGIAARALVKLKAWRKCTLSALAVWSQAMDIRLQADFNF